MLIWFFFLHCITYIYKKKLTHSHTLSFTSIKLWKPTTDYDASYNPNICLKMYAMRWIFIYSNKYLAFCRRLPYLFSHRCLLLLFEHFHLPTFKESKKNCILDELKKKKIKVSNKNKFTAVRCKLGKWQTQTSSISEQINFRCTCIPLVLGFIPGQ